MHHSHVAIKWLPSPLFPPASSFTASYVPKWTACAGPAPTITDDTPLHSARIPSVDDIRVNALPMPEYTAAGEAAKTCIRVCTYTRTQHMKCKGSERADFDAVDGKHDGVFGDACLVCET